MFLVQNTTRRTIMLSDIRIEVGPRKILDLEKVAKRSDLDQSRDLAIALKSKRLAIFRKTIIKNKEGKPTTKLVPDINAVEKIIKNNTITESKMKNLIKEIISESQPEIIKEKEMIVNPDVNESLQQIMKAIKDIENKPQQVIISQGNTEDNKLKENLTIDPGKLAEMQQGSIKKIQDQLKGSKGKKSRKMKIQDNKLQDLASELED